VTPGRDRPERYGDAARFLLRLLITAAGLALAAVVLNGIVVADQPDVNQWGQRAIITLLVVALMFGAINATIKPVVRVLTFPIYLLTLGIFALVVNALLLMLTGWLSTRLGFGFDVASFGTAVAGAIIVGVVSFVGSLVIPDARQDSRQGRS